MWLEVTQGKGEKMRKALPGASDRTPPQHQAPNTSSPLCYPPPRRGKIQGRRIQTTTKPARRVSGAGWERDSRRETGREWGDGRWGPGLWAGGPGLRWGGGHWGGEQLGGTPPHRPRRGRSTDHRNF